MLDQFGVLHDGKQPYPAAISTCNYNYCSTLSFFFFCFSHPVLYLPYYEANVSYVLILLVENIAKTGAKMVIISNSSRRSSTTIEKVKGLGFDASLFLGAVTSGELTHQYLQRLFLVSCFFPLHAAKHKPIIKWLFHSIILLFIILIAIILPKYLFDVYHVPLLSMTPCSIIISFIL